MAVLLTLYLPGFALALWLLRGDWRLPWFLKLGVAAAWPLVVPWAIAKGVKW